MLYALPLSNLSPPLSGERDWFALGSTSFQLCLHHPVKTVTESLVPQARLPPLQDVHRAPHASLLPPVPLSLGMFLSVFLFCLKKNNNNNNNNLPEDLPFNTRLFLKTTG